MGIHKNQMKYAPENAQLLPWQGSWLHTSHDHAFYGRFFLQGSLAHLQFHYLLSTSWARHRARDWRRKDEETWSLSSGRLQHTGGDWHAHKELQNNTFKAYSSMWNYVYFHVFIIIHSLSSTTTVEWTLLHSLLSVQHLSTSSLENVRDSVHMHE